VAEETPAGNELEQEESQFAPGELVAVDATDDRVDVPDDKVEILKGIARRVSQRDLTSRRLEVRDAWKARYFYRGNQHLLPWRGGWTLPPTSIVGDQNFNDHGQETNIYLAAGDILTASLTAGLPSVRFEPGDPNNPADNNAAENADKARLIIERDNDMIVVQEDIARFLFTDGRAVIYTKHILDAQRFGYYNPEPEIQEEESYLPETGGEGPDAPQQQTAPEGEQQPNANQEEAPQKPNRGEPRGQEVIKVFGVLESKLPIQANDLHCSDFCQVSYEQDITKAKAKYPDVADEIAPVQAPTAESDYERLARTSIMMGMRPSSMTSDSMTYNTTEQLTWVRPSFYSDTDINVEDRQWLYENFPDGLMTVINGNAFCEARNEGMDDHLTLIHARPGDGMHRPAMGSPAIPIQEKVNDCVDLMHEQCMHQIPNTWVQPDIDLQAMGDLQSKPKQYLKAPKLTGKATADLFYTEPQIELATGFMQYLQWLFGDCLQFLLGIYPALFGGNTGSNDTASGIASQRDQALGRIGLTWRNMKAGYSQIIRQAVQAAAQYRKEKIAGNVPGKDGKTMQIAIDPQDLKGDVRCFPDTDENFPESWVAKRAVWQQIIEMAAKNPVLATILNTPRNLRMAKDKVGVPELVIPGSDSSEKQLGEIMLLLQSPPAPNPQLQQMQEQAAQQLQAAQATGQPIDPAQVQQVQQQMQSIPPMVSTIPVGELDDHAMEAAEIKTWASTAEGIKAQSENQDGYQNVLTHYHEHIAALGPQQPQAAGKPPSDSLSVNFKDLPIDGQVQAAAKLGITLDAAKMQAEEQQNQAQELAAKAQAKPPMIQ
jgi:hypothetical protein